MEASLLTLLGLGTPEAGKQASVIPESPLSKAEAPDVRDAFAALLTLAEIRFRDEGKHRVARGEELEAVEALDELSYFRKLAQEMEQEMISGVAPAFVVPVEQLPLLESYVADVSFDPVAVATLHDGANSPVGRIPTILLPEEMTVNGVVSADISPEVGDYVPVDAVVQSKTGQNGQINQDVISKADNVPTEDVIYTGTIENNLTQLPVEAPLVAPVTPDVANAEVTAAVSHSPAVALTVAPVARTTASAAKEGATINDTMSVIALPERRLTSVMQSVDAVDSVDIKPVIATINGSNTAANNTTVNGAINPDMSLQTLFREVLTFAPLDEKAALQTFATETPEMVGGITEKSSVFDPRLLQEPSFIRLATAEATKERLTPAQQVSVQIVQATAEGQSRVSLQLHPVELGQVDVEMQIDGDNVTIARITTETREAYELLRADRASLERILQESGLKTHQQTLEFSFRGDGEQHQTSSGEQDTSSSVATSSTEQELTEAQGTESIVTDTVLSVTTGVNIKV